MKVVRDAHKQAAGGERLTRRQMKVVETVIDMANADPNGLLMPVVAAVSQTFGKPIPASTVSRWHRVGLKCGGQVVRLRVEQVGGRFYTRDAWLTEFVQRTTGRVS